MSQLYGRIVRQLCRSLSPVTSRLGFVLSPLHFYFPVPDTRDLAQRGVWDFRSRMPGVDWNEEGQLALLGELAKYGAEANWQVNRQSAPAAYSPHSETFGFASAMLAHSIVRHYRPRRIIEVGCGWSTLVLREALEKNSAAGDQFEDYLGIDPFPPEWLQLSSPKSRLRRAGVQEIEMEVFEKLGDRDLLFIDSTHVLAAGSDVQRIYLEILPRLRSGVVVHIHDIQLPWEYPRAYAEKQRWFWNEQYLLQAFLAFNSAFEILLAGQWLCIERAEILRKTFPAYDPKAHEPTGSIWLRKK